MTTVDVIDVSTIPTIDHREAMALHAVEFDRAVAMPRTLDADQWAAQTNCPRLGRAPDTAPCARGVPLLVIIDR